MRIPKNIHLLISAVSLGLPWLGLALEASVSVTNLPPSATLATEVSTNVPFALDEVGGGDFSMGFDAFTTPSNNVEMAIGFDADGDGVLAPHETGVLMGWRSGRWFYEDVACGHRRHSVSSFSDGQVRCLVWSMHIGHSPGRMSIRDAQGEVFPMADEAAAPFDYRWNLVRLTARGVDRRELSFQAEISRRHFHLHIR